VYASSSTITRSTGSFITDGWVVGGQIEITNSTSNDGTFLLTGVAALTLTLSGTPLSVEAIGASTFAYDQSNAFTTSLRIRDADPEGKTFQTSVLLNAGETAIASKVIKFPLANATDLDITSTDGTVSGSEPWTEVRLRYLDGTYNREVDSAVKRDFGIIVDVGTYSKDNATTAVSTLVTSANFQLGVGEALVDYTGGTLIIHEGSDQGSHAIAGTPVDNAGTLEVTLSGALGFVDTLISFTMERATPLTALRNEIYEKIQFQLRQATDIDATTGTVIGKVAGVLASFSGPDITFGLGSTNPNGGGTGVIVEGFDANDTNNMFFVDNSGTARNFPFVAAGNLNFNTNLTTDTAPEFWLYFKYTTRTTNADIDVTTPAGAGYTLTGTLPDLAVNDYIRISGFVDAGNNGLFRVTVENTPSVSYDVVRIDGEDVGGIETDQTVNIDEDPYNSPAAIIVDDNGGADIVGSASVASVAFDFDYDNNVQGGTNPRTQGTPAVCVLKAMGLETAQYVEVLDQTITRAVGLSFTATAALERNYDNP
jgi:hypothetical protein